MFLKKVFFITFVTFLTFSVVAQDYSHEFGVLTEYEKNMTVYEKDTTAEAVVIFDSGESAFYRDGDGFELYFKRHSKIKVLKESYINDANYSIPIYKGSSGKERIVDFKAYTYNTKNGHIQKTGLNKDQLFTENINKYWDNIKFAMPDIQVGSIIEFEYEVLSPYKFLLEDWEFQNEIPTIFSEYTVKMIPFYVYQLRLQGATSFDERRTYEEKGLKRQYHAVQFNDNIHYFAMKNVPAFKDEVFISSRDNFIMKLDFQLSQIHRYGGGTIEILSTWDELVKDLETDQDFGTYIKKSENKFKKIAEENDLSSKDDEEKTEFILNYIKQNYNWNNYPSIKARKPINTFLKEKTGSVAQLNLFLTGALRAVDIETYPVIISTRRNGKIIRSYPFLDPFNYVLAYATINGKHRLLDATDTYCPNDKIPQKCISDIGLVINKKDDVKWVKINRHEIALIQTDIKSTLSTDLDTLKGNFNITSTGYSAMYLRKRYADNIDRLEDQILDDGLELLDSVTTENYEDVNKPYSINYNASCLTEHINNKIFVHPFYYDVLQDNPLKESSRKYPVDMVYPKSKGYTNEIKIPDNYKIEKLPEDYFFNNKTFFLQYKVISDNGLIKIKAVYQFKKAVYQPEEYLKIKRYFSLIIKHFNQKIVLVKK